MPVARNVAVVRGNQLSTAIEQSYVALSIRLLLSLVPTALSIVAVTLGRGHECDKPLWTWLAVHILFEGSGVPLMIMSTYLARRQRQGGLAWTRLKRWTSRLGWVSFIWIIPGNEWFFATNTCSHTNPWVYSVTKTCIILYWVLLALPFATILLYCLCSPCLHNIFTRLNIHHLINNSINYVPHHAQHINNIAEHVHHGDAEIGIEVAPGGSSAAADVPGCCICCTDFEPHVTVVCKLPGCGHEFCAPCVKQWLHKNPTCPLCRAPAIVM